MSCTLFYGGKILGENLCFHIQGTSEDTLKMNLFFCLAISSAVLFLNIQALCSEVDSDFVFFMREAVGSSKSRSGVAMPRNALLKYS